MKSTIRLFKAVPITKQGKKNLSESLLERMIPYGFFLAPEIIYNYPESELDNLIKTIINEFGLSGEQINNSFHKSWNKVAKADIKQLVIEQLIHYFTTYGFKQLGIYSEESIYIPREKLEIPELDVDGFHFVIIKGYTNEELKEKLFELLGSGIALGEETIKDVLDIGTYLEIDEKEVQTIKNKEVKTALYDYFGLFPENPIEFLRYCVYKSTSQTLLIKNQKTLDLIKSSNNLGVLSLFTKYKQKYGFEILAQIFLRFKPIFLAFRTNTQMKKYTNKIRKLAITYHRAMKTDYINDVTSLIKKDEIDLTKLKHELEKVNTFRKIRLSYALKYRTTKAESILYRIRNGKGYATNFTFDNKKMAEKALSIILESIISDISKKIKGKKIYIPNLMIYTLPATEKQFTGNFPSGSYVSIPQDMVFGIHWENVKSRSIDLDLSIINPETGKFGWDSSYKTEEGNILFSGDLTDAPKPKGASELFHVKKNSELDYILFVNYYNFINGTEIPFKIIIAKAQGSKFEDYMVNPNNVIAIAKTTITQKSKVLGLVVTLPDECRFYFAETYLGRSITSSITPFGEHSRQYLTNFYKDTINLNEILLKAGAIITDDREECDIDLSPETIEKDTIIKLIR